eukprot:2110744-Pleurochrysis_carterae.AAC.1
MGGNRKSRRRITSVGDVSARAATCARRSATPSVPQPRAWATGTARSASTRGSVRKLANWAATA